MPFTKYLKTTPETSFYRFAAFLDAKEVQRQACRACPFNFAVILRNKTQHSPRMPAKDACCSFRFYFQPYVSINVETAIHPKLCTALLPISFDNISPGGATDCKFVIAICLHCRGTRNCTKLHVAPCVLDILHFPRMVTCPWHVLASHEGFQHKRSCGQCLD